MHSGNGFTSHLKDLVSALILGLVAFGMGKVASASQLDPLVNSNIKEEFIRIDVQQQKAQLEYPQDNSGTLVNLPLRPMPFNQNDPLLNGDISPTTLGEQEGTIDRPRGGLAQRADVMENIQQKMIDIQAYKNYREHYRNAVQNEYEHRLNNAGYQLDRHLAEEIRIHEEKFTR